MPPQKTKKQIDALEGRQRPLDKVLFSHSESALYASLFSDLFKYVTMRTFIDSSFFLFRVSTFDLWFSVFFFFQVVLNFTGSVEANQYIRCCTNTHT